MEDITGFESQLIQAIPSDIQEILALFHAVKLKMRSHGLDQWPDTYPSEKAFEKAIAEKTVWVKKKEEVIQATFILDTNQDIDYLDVNWQFEGETIYVLHKVAVHPDYQGLGLGKKMTQAALYKAKKAGGDAFRLDTYSLNPVSVQLYKSIGFSLADGYCYFHGHKAPFYCFEMRL